ncbi:MAG TPA: monofunctional biosynthetic peptidoglycan transglycosylase [Salinarimonas sp.]|nr:monofunctional biosynthetic peptidoglycan transglycosylase [Salinarimonas sp.]
MIGRIARGIGLALAGLVAAFMTLSLLYWLVTPPSTLMLGRWLTLSPVDRRAVSLGAVSEHLPRAVVTSEDGRFCRHGGVDWGALRDVIDDEDGPSRGASTIPMQVAKNLFLWPGRSYLRKGIEIPVALWLDLVWSKRRMMEVYLNVAEWGDGIFGAEAAARAYFGKSARDLTRREAALLATALPNPKRRDPSRPSAGHRRLADRLTARMAAAGPLTECL